MQNSEYGKTKKPNFYIIMYIHIYVAMYIPEGHSKNDKSILSSCGLTVTGNSSYVSNFCTALGSL